MMRLAARAADFVMTVGADDRDRRRALRHTLIDLREQNKNMVCRMSIAPGEAHREAQ
jgi:hypothetical protein